MIARCLAAAVATLGLAACAPQEPEPSAGEFAIDQRPNILLIISDDVGTDVTSDMFPGLIERLQATYGADGFDHPQAGRIDGHPASTPVLDAFAASGMTFSQTWAQPFCSPTRASILTGLNVRQHGVATYADALDQSHTSFVQALSDAGYATAVFGKWHMAGLPNPNGEDYPGMKPREAGFDYFSGNMHAALPTFWDWELQVQDAETAPGEWRSSPAPARSLPGVAPTTNAGVVKVAELLDWMEEREAEPERPWFGWLAFHLSHATIDQDPSAMMIPEADLLDAATRAEVEACGGTYASQDVGQCSGEAQMRFMTNAMDTLIGHVLRAVPPNTYVIYVGDNGTPMYGRPQLDFIDNMYITREARGKGTAWQGGALVPLAIAGPGIPAGSSNGEISHVADLFPTILQLAGLNVPERVSNGTRGGTTTLAGRSLAPLLFGRAESVRDPQSDVVLTESVNLMTGGTRVVGIRNARYKLVCADDPADCEFFDIAADPLEQYPLATPESCAAGGGRGVEASNYCTLRGALAAESIFAS
ncbi:sulfatase-like hydrolase/transferase [Aurantiacibacter sp. MUD11]|uniref:sulfatase family protein n=1 Tax=Aurantiacibacter sp. MUD11 TaxID=3003265 RepID=UPI0022AB42EE|nr:sulfatase-like hydrolase/transferase [Aurantiacibacter sp. MUD11]WAT17284.1 sulfatase-like hydrolase/transferase [Aurantiacibacter sp. MUD11]